MEDVKCPKCKEDLQFPFMICPDCKWKAKGKDIQQHNFYARRYIAERPYEEQDQLKMVLDSVMVEKESAKVEKLDRSAIRGDINEKIKFYHIVITGVIGMVWLSFVVLMLITGGPVIFINIFCLIVEFIGFFCLIATPILLVLKLNALRR